jgi:pterin-4a-carbinolamine dehydratase
VEFGIRITWADERGFQKIRTENEAEFYKLLTDMMHKAQSNYHQLTHHPDIATEWK